MSHSTVTDARPTYDQRCFDLAEVFLSDEPRLAGRAAELAAHIQGHVEEWIVYEREHSPIEPRAAIASSQGAR